MDGSRFSPDALKGLIFRKKEKAVTPQLEAKFQTLGQTFKIIGNLIPQKGLEEFKDRQRLPKKKEFNPKAALSKVRQVFQSQFPDSSVQGAVVDEANKLISGVAEQVDPKDRDLHPLERVDNFLGGFPDNMIKRLGANATPEIVSQILKIGQIALKKNIEHEKEFRDREGPYVHLDVNYPLGAILDLVGKDIPEAINRPGADPKELLQFFSENASIMDIFNFGRAVEYFKNRILPTSSQLERVSQMEMVMSELNSEERVNNKNPFSKPERSPWLNTRDMGRERRTPVWKDIADMIRASEEDGLEYGIAITRNPEDETKPLLEYLRGSTHNIHNGGARRNSKEVVFLHVHPSSDLEHTLTAPLVSRGDLTADVMQDYGGGYRNVVTVNGLTVHTGGEKIEEEAEPPKTEKGTPLQYTYQAETGAFKGMEISSTGSHGQTLNAMSRLLESGAPFGYSISDNFGKTKYYFMHFPWKTLDKSVPFYSLLFSDGLEKVLSGVPDIPQVQRGANLDQVMDITDRIHTEAVTKGLEERKSRSD